MKNLLGLIYLISMLIFTACLPQEKTTQCRSNEAYNATTRSCVPTLGASSTTVNISNVTPSSSYFVNSSDVSKTHTVTVSDPYNNGYVIEWRLTQPNGSTLNLGNSSSLTFNHSAYPTGSYILEVLLKDTNGTETYDTRSWTVNIIAEQTPEITAITTSPFTTRTNSSSTLIDATVSNPDSLTVDYQWYVNGSAIAGENGVFSTTNATAIDFNFNPTDSAPYHVGAGTYTIQLRLTENGSTTVYDIETWIVTNNIPGFANVTRGIDNTFGNLTPSTAANITAIIDTNITSPNAFLSDINNDGVLDSIDFCAQVDNISGVDNQGVFVDFLENGVKVAGAQFGVNNQEVCLGDLNSGFQVTISSNFIYSQSTTISAIVYDEYSGSSNNPSYSTGTQLEAFNWIIEKRRANTPPIVTIDTANTAIGWDQDGDGVVDTGVDDVHSCTTVSSTSETNCTITQDFPFTVAINVEDDDYSSTDYSQFQVEFEVNNTDLDGSTPTVSSTDCFHTTGETNTSAKYICNLTINSYDSITGPINASTANYTITAKVTDTGTLPYGGAALESNEVSWTVSTVREANSGISLNSFDITAGATPATDSYIALSGAPAVPINANSGTLSEGDQIVFAVNVDDPERDSHTITIDRCANLACSTTEEFNIVSKITISSDGANPRTTYINYTIGEDDVVGADSKTVYYKVSVQDNIGTTTPGSDSEVIGFAVNNLDIDPVFEDTFTPDTSLTYTAFAGFPFTMDVGNVTDASSIADSDGDQVLYQWLVRLDTDQDGTITDESWRPIQGATLSTLTWIPSSEADFTNLDGTLAQVKLCTGDDGWDNALNITKSPLNATQTDCSDTIAAGRDSSTQEKEWDLTIYSNMSQGFGLREDSLTSNGQIDVWIDPSTTDPLVKYMVYQNNVNQIVVEKIVISSNGEKFGSIGKETYRVAGESEISYLLFDSTSTAATKVTNLSIAGDSVNKELYISYMAPYSGQSGADSVHIRRIDISGGKTGFTHDGKFGNDKDYNGIVNDITVSSTEIASESLNSDGLVELDVQGIDTNTTTIDFSGINGGALTLTEGVDFCSPSCTSTVDMATSLVEAINSSTHKELQGLTASRNASTVLLSGIADNDFIQVDYRASTIGQIMVNQTTGQWELPYLDNSLADPDKNKVRILHSSLGQRLVESNVQSTLLSSTVQSQSIINKIDGNDKILISTIGFSDLRVSAFEIGTTVGPVYTVLRSNTDVFGTNTISDLRISVGKTTTNTSAFLVGKNNSNNEVALARFDATAGNYNIDTGYYVTTDLDSNFSMFDNTNFYDIAAGANDKELFIGSVNNLDNALYLYRVEGDTTPSIDCNYDSSGLTSTNNCQKVKPTSTDNIADSGVAMTDVIENITLGSAGSTAGENVKDVLAIGYHSGTSPNFDPIIGLLNVDETSRSAESAGTYQDTSYNLPYVSE